MQDVGHMLQLDSLRHLLSWRSSGPIPAMALAQAKLQAWEAGGSTYSSFSAAS